MWITHVDGERLPQGNTLALKQGAIDPTKPFFQANEPIEVGTWIEKGKQPLLQKKPSKTSFGASYNSFPFTLNYIGSFEIWNDCRMMISVDSEVPNEDEPKLTELFFFLVPCRHGCVVGRLSRFAKGRIR